MSAATPEAQKRRSDLIDRVRPTPLGASALTRRPSSGRCERFSAAANRRPTLQEATVLSEYENARAIVDVMMTRLV